MPPLRERKEDIPLLVEYFIDRYASKAGKKIRGTNKKTLDLLQSYPWQGNIRELQNVIERSIIVCDTETFSVDESWLVRDSRQTRSANQPLSDKLLTQEKEMIEAALAESGGRVSGRQVRPPSSDASQPWNRRSNPSKSTNISSRNPPRSCTTRLNSLFTNFRKFAKNHAQEICCHPVFSMLRLALTLHYAGQKVSAV
jgi:transcriptional regulator with AAA-type ATPase domain